jgi:hypothetical protein
LLIGLLCSLVFVLGNSGLIGVFFSLFAGLVEPVDNLDFVADLDGSCSTGRFSAFFAVDLPVDLAESADFEWRLEFVEVSAAPVRELADFRRASPEVDGSHKEVVVDTPDPTPSFRAVLEAALVP